MRIIAGELGGRRLQAPKGESVRPTTDRVREALFSILGDLSGLDVLDLYAGTGALGLEALSRGARDVTLVDSDIGPAEANVEALGVGERVALIRSDAAKFLQRDGATYDLVLLDPPYRLARPVAPELTALLRPRLREGGRVVVESAGEQPLDLDQSVLPLRDERRYGSTLLRTHVLEEAAR